MASQGMSYMGAEFSRDDYTLLVKSFKDKKFRELLCDYAREVNDPDNRKQFEKEVIEYEKERGVDVAFLHPRPGFALTLVESDVEPTFVNICSSDVIQKSDLQPVSSDGKQCHRWLLPHAVAKPRREVVARQGGGGGGREDPSECGSRKDTPAEGKGESQRGDRVLVYDVVFHPDTLHLALGSPVMKQTLIDTASDSLRKHFGVQIGALEQVDKEYIGAPSQCIIKRTVNEKHCDQTDEQHMAYLDHRTNIMTGDEVSVGGDVSSDKSKFIQPKYKLKHVSKMDIQDFASHLIPQCNVPSQPQALELEVSLPGVSRASQVNADIQHQSVHLTTESTPKYKLELPLRYPIDEDRSSAKFDVSTSKLTLTLSVMPSNKNSEKVGSQGQSPPSDSGIECELDYRTNGECDHVSEGSMSPQDCATDLLSETERVDEDGVFESSKTEQRITIAPNYSIQQTKEILQVYLCCGNVLPNSIRTEQVMSGAKIELSSIGGGQTLLHYSLEVDVSPCKIAASGLTYKEEDGKVVMSMKKATAGLWGTCKISHGDSVTIVTLPTSEDITEDGPADETQSNSKSCSSVPRAPRMARAVSMCETEASHPFRLRGPTCSWPRGILKHRVRSLSESQVGTYSEVPIALTSGSLDLDVFESKSRFGDEDEGDESVASSLGEKKSVRFNEVVSRQLFRSNSSILGQRAKNQRKAIRKRKSRARKEFNGEKDAGINMSESASGDSDITTDATTDDDVDATNSSTTEVDDSVDVDSYAANTNNIGSRKVFDGVLQPLRESNKNSNVHKSANNNNNNNNNNNSDDNSNNNLGDNECMKNMSQEEDDGDGDFILKTSKKKKRKNRKNKIPTFEPTNTLIFQLDMDK